MTVGPTPLELARPRREAESWPTSAIGRLLEVLWPAATSDERTPRTILAVRVLCDVLRDREQA